MPTEKWISGQSFHLYNEVLHNYQKIAIYERMGVKN